MSIDAAALMSQAADLTHKVAELLAAGRVDEAEEADRQAHRMRLRALRLARNSPANLGADTAYAPAQSDRATIVQGLIELDAISSPRLLSDYLAARFSSYVSPRQFSSLRRDEREAWKRPAASRMAFVVPALEGSYFTPARGQLAVSTWPTWRRMVGPRTGRVELLRAARAVLEQRSWLTDSHKDGASRMERLLVVLVRTVPDALEGWTVRDPVHTGEAIERELRVLEEADRDWRQEAASRAESQLDEGELLWGARAPHLLKAHEGGR